MRHSAPWDPTAQYLLAALTWSLRRESIAAAQMATPGALPLATLLPAANRHKVLTPVADHAAAHTAIPGLREATRRSAVKAMSLATTTLEISGRLRAAGVDALFLKGVVLAIQTTGRVNARGAGDIDLLVTHGALPRTVTILESEGWQVRAGWGALTSSTPPLHGHAVTLDRAGISVDVHHRLDHALATASVDHGQLWKRRVNVPVGGDEVATLRPIDSAVSIAVNSGQDAWAQLIRAADFLRLLNLVEKDGGDVGVVLQRGREWGAQGRTSVAVAVVRRVRPDLPRQNPLAESLARDVWLRFARGDAIWNTGRLTDKVQVDLFRLAATASGSYSRWWARRLAQRALEATRPATHGPSM